MILIGLMGGKVGVGLKVGRRLTLKYPSHKALIIGDYVSFWLNIVIDVPES